ncbi:cation:dicarboxylate symporter family transporter [Vaginisenegalia massiliensis]|uniref:L-cystine transporter n=1 Tax=Vaginisenegalia massiliensis TaxID=2058294 RepID=UPI000F539602
MNGLLILFLAIFIALLYFLYYLSNKHLAYSKRVMTGLAMGIILGGLIQFTIGQNQNLVSQLNDWISIIGSLYIKLLQMLIVPLIFVSLVTAFTKMKDQHNLGKISFNIIALLMITVSIAAAIGISMILLFNLDGATFTKGAQEVARISSLTEKQASLTDLTLPQQIIAFIPSNIFEDFAGLRPTSTIAVVIFSALVGTAYLGVERKHPDEAATFKRLIDALHAIVMRMVTLVLRLAPYGILALMTNMVASSSLKALMNMGTFLIASYAAFFIMFMVHALILILHGLSAKRFFQKVRQVLLFAFTSRSSGAAVPLNIETQEQTLGVPTTIANFAASLGMSIGQNGCAGIYPAMLVAILAPKVGLDLSQPMVWLSLIATIAISSFGVAGVGGGATFASLIVFGALGLPIELIGLMVSIEPVIDMGRTALNVNDSILAGVISAKRMNQLDLAAYNDPNRQLEPTN